jgi:hypothetical protein
MSVEHKSLGDEVLFVIGRASEPLDSGQIYERCDLADEIKQVSNAIFRLKTDGKIVNAEGEGRARYVLASGVKAAAPAGKAGRPAAVEVPVLGSPPFEAKAIIHTNPDQVAQALGYVEAAQAAKGTAPKRNDAALADALLDKTRAQLGRPAVRWWIDQDGGIAIDDDGAAVFVDHVQAERMARLLMSFHDALEDV